MGFMFCDLHVSLKLPFAGDINLTNLSCLELAQSRNRGVSGSSIIGDTALYPCARLPFV